MNKNGTLFSDSKKNADSKMSPELFRSQNELHDELISAFIDGNIDKQELNLLLMQWNGVSQKKWQIYNQISKVINSNNDQKPQVNDSFFRGFITQFALEASHEVQPKSHFQFFHFKKLFFYSASFIVVTIFFMQFKLFNNSFYQHKVVFKNDIKTASLITVEESYPNPQLSLIHPYSSAFHMPLENASDCPNLTRLN